MIPSPVANVDYIVNDCHPFISWLDYLLRIWVKNKDQNQAVGEEKD